jgi:hypothetical protein
MADTARTISALQTLLADNTSRQISPQDLRDFLVSTLNIEETGTQTMAGALTVEGDLVTNGAINAGSSTIGSASQFTVDSGGNVVGTRFQIGSDDLITETNAQDYADTAASTAQGNAQDYADGVAATAQGAAQTYADGVAATAQNNAQNYADGVASSAASTAQTNAQNYTDSTVTGLNLVPSGGSAGDILYNNGGSYAWSALSGYLAGFATESYANNAASVAQSNAESYANNAASNAVVSAQGYTDSVASTTLSTAQGYTDTEIGALSIPTVIGDLISGATDTSGSLALTGTLTTTAIVIGAGECITNDLTFSGDLGLFRTLTIGGSGIDGVINVHDDNGTPTIVMTGDDGLITAGSVAVSSVTTVSVTAGFDSEPGSIEVYDGVPALNALTIKLDGPTGSVMCNALWLTGTDATDPTAETVAGRLPIYDADGDLLGYIPIYEAP